MTIYNGKSQVRLGSCKLVNHKLVNRKLVNRN